MISVNTVPLVVAAPLNNNHLFMKCYMLLIPTGDAKTCRGMDVRL